MPTWCYSANTRCIWSIRAIVANAFDWCTPVAASVSYSHSIQLSICIRGWLDVRRYICRVGVIPSRSSFFRSQLELHPVPISVIYNWNIYPMSCFVLVVNVSWHISIYDAMHYGFDLHVAEKSNTYLMMVKKCFYFRQCRQSVGLTILFDCNRYVTSISPTIISDRCQVVWCNWMHLLNLTYPAIDYNICRHIYDFSPSE